MSYLLIQSQDLLLTLGLNRLTRKGLDTISFLEMIPLLFVVACFLMYPLTGHGNTQTLGRLFVLLSQNVSTEKILFESVGGLKQIKLDYGLQKVRALSYGTEDLPASSESIVLVNGEKKDGLGAGVRLVVMHGAEVTLSRVHLFDYSQTEQQFWKTYDEIQDGSVIVVVIHRTVGWHQNDTTTEHQIKSFGGRDISLNKGDSYCLIGYYGQGKPFNPVEQHKQYPHGPSRCTQEFLTKGNKVI